MRPKSSSKNDQTYNWLLCEKCKIYITSKDRNRHEEDCPIPNEITESIQLIYTIIRTKQIYARQLCEATNQTAAILSDELWSDLGSKYLKNLLFASASVMSLCDWIISDFVVLQSSCDTYIPVVRRVWPAADKNTSSVFVTDDELRAAWQDVTSFTITKLPYDPPPAATMTIKLVSFVYWLNI